MCGICGIFNYAGTSPELEGGLVEAMRDTMAHRGPDDAGVYLSADRRVGLGHRRLSIIDLSPQGHQPMCNEDGSVWIVYNGEIYNHQVLRKRLEAAGHVYKSRSDTETILHLYEEKGVRCLDELEGMFAFAIWDSRRNHLFMARDRLGKKPLYYTVQNGRLAFASEIKAILKLPGIKREVNKAALYHYLTLFVTPAPMTLFEGISKLPAGRFMVCDAAGNLRQERYWDAIVSTAEAHPEEFYIAGIRRLLSESIEKRMMSDVPFGVFLSGGIDSSTNVALMARLMDRPVDTFSVGFKDQPGYNEFDYARQVAAEFKTNHHEVTIDEQDLMGYVHDLVYHQDEPVADWVCVPLYFVSRLARDNGTIVIQIGEGSDEIFFGYEGYFDYLNAYHRYWKPYLGTPAFFRKAVYGMASPFAPLFKKGIVEELLRRAAGGEEFFWGGAVAFTETDKRRLMAGEWRGLNSARVVRDCLSGIDSKKPGADYVERMAYLELKHRLPELLLMRVDKITMSTSVEGRAPYLDQKLVEFAMAIPGALKTKNGQTKYILKQAVKGIIPDNIINRKKQGFSTPVKEWFNGELGQYMSHSILGSRIHERGFLNQDYIKALLEKQRAGKADNSSRLWILFNLSKWYDYWIAGDSEGNTNAG